MRGRNLLPDRPDRGGVGFQVAGPRWDQASTVAVSGRMPPPRPRQRDRRGPAPRCRSGWPRCTRGSRTQSVQQQPRRRRAMALQGTEVQKALKGVDYPATKEELASHAEGNGADRELVDALGSMNKDSF